MDASEYPQPLWERAVAALQSNGQPVTAQSIQAMMNNLAGDPGVDGDGPDVESKLDALSEGYVPSAAPNPPPVDKVMLPGVNPHTGRGMDQHAYNNMQAEAKQGPGKLRSDDAMADDARGGANTTSDTSNTPPGTQDASQSASSPYWNAPVAPNGMSTSFADISGGDVTKGGIAAAIAATLSKRYKPSMGQSIHLGNVHAPQAASLYEGVITAATPQEMAKAKTKPSNNVRSRTAKRKKKDDE